jgi:uncharacterized protein YkwD
LAAPAGASSSRASSPRSPRSRVCGGANLRPSAANAATIDAATICLINQIRAGAHLRPLRPNSTLQAVAVSQVSDMIRSNYFADARPSGSTAGTLIAATPYGANTASLSVGQNIGWATGADTTPAQMVTTWMRSPEHRAIILTGEFHDAGVGVTPALPAVLGHGRRGATYAIEFGVRWF